MADKDFKFPDEKDDDLKKDTVAAGAEDDLEIEVVDDTPDEDKGRKPLKDVKEPTEEELENYSQKVKDRIAELTHARHDERREKERLAREHEQLAQLAQRLLDENNSLKTTGAKTQDALMSTAKEKAKADLDAAKRDLKEAHEAFDTEKIVEAQERLSEAKMRLVQIENYRPASSQSGTNDVQTRSNQRTPEQQLERRAATVDEKALRWQARNQWFQQSGFEDVTAYAMGLHQKLVNSEGVDPRTDEYYAQLDARLKAKFPEVFGEKSELEPGETTAKRPQSVVAPASRTSAGPKKITLKASQLAIAKKLGLTPKQYAEQVAKLENQNG